MPDQDRTSAPGQYINKMVQLPLTYYNVVTFRRPHITAVTNNGLTQGIDY